MVPLVPTKRFREERSAGGSPRWETTSGVPKSISITSDERRNTPPRTASRCAYGADLRC